MTPAVNVRGDVAVKAFGPESPLMTMSPPSEVIEPSRRTPLPWVSAVPTAYPVVEFKPPVIRTEPPWVKIAEPAAVNTAPELLPSESDQRVSGPSLVSNWNPSR